MKLQDLSVEDIIYSDRIAQPIKVACDVTGFSVEEPPGAAGAGLRRLRGLMRHDGRSAGRALANFERVVSDQLPLLSPLVDDLLQLVL